MKRAYKAISIISAVILLAGCNLPDNTQSEELDPTSAAIVEMTVSAVQQSAGSNVSGDDELLAGKYPCGRHP